jgi:hypothetical protein
VPSIISRLGGNIPRCQGVHYFQRQLDEFSKYFSFSHFYAFLEHIVLCFPLILYKRALDERNKQLSDLFPPLNDELYSTYMVNLLLAVGLTVAFFLPPIQYGLARLYFVYGHPWSRILNVKLRSE